MHTDAEPSGPAKGWVRPECTRHDQEIACHAGHRPSTFPPCGVPVANLLADLPTTDGTRADRLIRPADRRPRSPTIPAAGVERQPSFSFGGA